jgi:acyl carrier protein
MSPPPTSPETIESALADAIAARTGRRPVATDSVGSLGIDSVDLANLVGDLERRFGFRADETIFDVTTVGELAAYIRARLGTR